MEQGERLKAPGRLRARAGMDRVEVALPPYLRGLNRAYLGFVAALFAFVAGYLFVNERGDSESLPNILTFSLYVAGIFAGGFLVLLLYSHLVVRLARWVSDASGLDHWRVFLTVLGLGLPAALVLGWNGMALIYVVYAGEGDSLVWVFLATPLVAGLFLLGMLRGAMRAPRVALEGARLEIREGRSRWVLPLEAVGRIERRASGRRERVLLGGQPIGALRGLTDAEREWLFSLVEGAAQRRRDALERQGHDLAEPAEPPEALRDLARRSPIGTGR